jgi:hypothetical protein
MRYSTKIAVVVLGMATFSTGIMADASISKGLAVKAATACKDYVVGKVNLPMAAVSAPANRVYGNKEKVYVYINVQWDDPHVAEEGECIYVHGKAISFRAFKD